MCSKKCTTGQCCQTSFLNRGGGSFLTLPLCAVTDIWLPHPLEEIISKGMGVRVKSLFWYCYLVEMLWPPKLCTTFEVNSIQMKIVCIYCIFPKFHQNQHLTADIRGVFRGHAFSTFQAYTHTFLLLSFPPITPLYIHIVLWDFLAFRSSCSYVNTCEYATKVSKATICWCHTLSLWKKWLKCNFSHFLGAFVTYKGAQKRPKCL